MQTTKDWVAESLVILAEYHGCHTSATSLVANLPLEQGMLTPKLVDRALEKIDFKSKITKVSLEALDAAFMPCVLFLKDNQACVLFKVDGDKATIQKPGTEKAEVDLAELIASYSGYLLLASPQYESDSRSAHIKQKKMKHWFWGTLWQFRKDYMPIALATFLSNLMALALPMFMVNVYNRVLPNNAFTTLWTLAAGVFIAYVFDLLFKVARDVLVESNGKKIDLTLGAKLFTRIMNTRLAYKPISAGGFANNLRDFENLRSFFTSTTVTALVDLPFIFVFLLTIGLLASWYLVFIPLFFGFLMMITAYFCHKREERLTEQSMQAGVSKQACMIEAVAAMEDIKALNAEESWQRKWESHVARVAAVGEKVSAINSFATHVNTFCMMTSLVCIAIAGVYLFLNDMTTMGGILVSVMLSSRALSPIIGLTRLFSRYSLAKGSLNALDNLFELPMERETGKELLSRPNLKGNFSLEHVSFKYPNTEDFALRDVNLEIKAGEKIAILGKVGSGKTTLLKLLLGFYQANEGVISVDDTDIRHVDPTNLRANIAYAPQNPALVHDSLVSNMLLGKTGVNDESIIRAAKAAHLGEVIKRSKSGFNMEIYERGDNLSGGQKQLVSMSRVFVSSAGTLLLDEPVGSVDSLTENRLKASLQKFSQNKTVVIVTHRSSMLQLVDRIILMDQGRIKADGPKDEVLKLLRGEGPKAVRKGEQDV